MAITSTDFNVVANKDQRATQEQIDELNAVLTYLAQNMKSYAALQELKKVVSVEEYPRHITINFISDRSDSFNPLPGQSAYHPEKPPFSVNWSPEYAIMTGDSTVAGFLGNVTGMESASLLFLHEIFHTLDKDVLHNLGTNSSQYVNLAEGKAVTETNGIALVIGEPLRNSYGIALGQPSSLIGVTNPTEHTTNQSNWQEQSLNGQATITGGAYQLNSRPANAPDLATFFTANNKGYIANVQNSSISIDSNSFSSATQYSSYVIGGGSGSDTIYGGDGIRSIEITAGSRYVLNFGGPKSFTAIKGSKSAPSLVDGNQTWSDENNTQYIYDRSEGTLTIVGASGNKYIIDGFTSDDLRLAQGGTPVDGITLGQSTALAPGVPQNPIANGGAKPVNLSVSTSGDVQFVTVYASSAQDVAQTETVTVSGSGMYRDMGSSIVPIDGAFTVTIPAGQDSVSFGLVGSGTSQTAQTAQVTASLDSDSAVSNTLTVNFSGASNAANPVISLSDLAPATAPTGVGQVSVNAAQLTSATGNGTADTWTGSDGTTYQFAPGGNVAQGYGTLAMSGGSLPAGDQVTLANFNLGTATGSGTGGYLGITLQGQYAIEGAGGANPFATTGNKFANATTSSTGTGVGFTIYAPSGSTQARTVNLTLSGNAALYQLITGTGTVNFSGNTAVLTIPAGVSSLYCTLNYTGTDKTPQSATLSLSPAQGGSAIESNTLTANIQSTATGGTGAGSGGTVPADRILTSCAD